VEKKEGGNKIEREKGGVRERKRSSGSGKGKCNWKPGGVVVLYFISISCCEVAERAQEKGRETRW